MRHSRCDWSRLLSGGRVMEERAEGSLGVQERRAVAYQKADRSRYTSADAITISVYSHVFNVNPALDDAQVLLLDDAHAAN
jgi:hypothetical protein